MINKSVLKTIQYYSLFADWEIAFNGKAKGNQHLKRVSKIAEFLAKKENARKDIVEAAAWLHDIGLIKGNDDDHKKIKKIALDFLNTLILSVQDKELIASCVESHEGMVNAKTIEAKVVHDADVIDKSGFLGVIRHTWKITNLINKDASSDKIFEILKKHLLWRESMLYTKSAKSVIKKLNKNLSVFLKNKTEAIMIIDEIKNYAKQGFTTEQIANALKANKKLNRNFINMLFVQLECAFLK